MRAPLLLAACALVVLTGCGGGPDRRERVATYLEDANEVQAGWSEAFTEAGEAYIAFSRNELTGDKAELALTTAAGDLREARAELAGLEPPEDAAPLHRKLLRLFDLNVEFAEQTAVLAAYVPAAEAALAPLERVNGRLQERLGGAGDADEQARALAAFSGRLEGMQAELRALDAPTVLAPSHRDQMRALDRTRGYAEQLRDALLDRDAVAVADLLEKFRARPGADRARRIAARRAIVEYERRYKALNDAYIDVRREETRLDQAFA